MSSVHMIMVRLDAVAYTLCGRGEEVQVEQKSPQQGPKLSPREKRRIAARGNPRYTKRNKKGAKIKG